MMERPRVVLPALPPPAGVNPQKARFFAEAAAGAELMALYWASSAELQQAFHDVVRAMSAAQAQGIVDAQA